MLGKFRKDDDGHWYFIPQERLEEFDATMRDIEEADSYSDDWYEYVDFFISRFDDYRCEPPQSYLVELNIKEQGE
jgi:hypothetical protein